MYLVVLFLPLGGALLTGLLGWRLGRRGSELIVISSVLGSSVLALFGCYEVCLRKVELTIELGRWLDNGLLDSGFGIKVDSLSSSLSVLITFITSLVIVYSGEYLGLDKGYVGYLSSISFFSFFMLILVLANNLLLLFVGWEGVGVVSYLLICYWGTSLDASKSGIQAMLVNRLGDVSFLLGIVCLFSEFGSVRFDVIFNLVESGSSLQLVGGALLIIGGMSKSAQVGLHLWLANAMAAPTPVSALLHAATMVTAGVYLYVRISWLLEEYTVLLWGLVVIGGITLIVSGSIGLVTQDIKRIIAYSTGSQLGYMVLCCGLSGYKVAVYHLLNHGFFKALLFLSAGMVIHGVRDEQDLRRLGGLRSLMPLSYMGFLVGSVALVGLPFLSGFYSKDAILELAFMSRGSVGVLGYGLGLVGAFFTALYSMRLLLVLFIKKAQGVREVVVGVGEGGLRMSLPLVLLGVLSIVFGYLGSDCFIGGGSDYWGSSIRVGSNNERLLEGEFLSPVIKLLPVIVSGLGLSFGFFFFIQEERLIYRLKKGNPFYVFLLMRWTFDKICNEVILQEVLVLGYKVTFKEIDRGLLEVVGPEGINRGLLVLGGFQSNLQTGWLRSYLMVVLLTIGLLVLMVV